MIITHGDGLYQAVINFDERLIFQQAKWVWSATHKRWVTSDSKKAADFEPFFDAAADAALAAWRAGSLALVDRSYAVAPVDPRAHDIPAPPGLSYDPAQKVAIWEYALGRKDTLDADPPGCGKTIVGVGVSNAIPSIRRVLIACPAHLKSNWAREWRKWDVKGLSVDIARSKIRSRTERDEAGEKKIVRWTERHWPDTDVVVINYDLLENYEEELREKEWDLLVCDESQYLVSETSVRARHILGGGKQHIKRKQPDGSIKKIKRPSIDPIPAKKRLFLSGTPLLNAPVDLWTMVKACDPNGLGKNWKSFVYRYCGASKAFGRLDTSGATNLEELQVKLRTAFMIRRRKADVLRDLPPKRRQLVPLPADGLAKLLDREKTAYTRIRDALRGFEVAVGLRPADDTAEPWTTLADVLEARFGRVLDLGYEEAAKHFGGTEAVAFEELSSIRKELAAAKIPMVIEHVNNLRSGGEKVVVFCVHKEMAKALRDAWPGCAFVTGNVASNKRQAEIDRFQDDPTCDVAVGNIIAMGTGFTMTASRIVVFAELDWVTARIEQAEDRIHRRGQAFSVLAQHLAVEDSVDFRMVEAIIRKQEITHTALDADALDFSCLTA